MARLVRLREDILDFAANAGLYMMRHINDKVEKRFFCGVVRGTEEGQRERETLLYSETTTAANDLTVLAGRAGRAYKCTETSGKHRCGLIGRRRNCGPSM